MNNPDSNSAQNNASPPEILGSMFATLATFILTPLFLGLALFCSFKTVTTLVHGNLFTGLFLASLSILLYFLAFQCSQLLKAKAIHVFNPKPDNLSDLEITQSGDHRTDIADDIRLELPKTPFNQFIGRVFNTLFLWFRIVLTILLVALLVWSVVDSNKEKISLIVVCLILLLFTHYRVLINSGRMSFEQMMTAVKRGQFVVTVIIVLPIVLTIVKKVLDNL